ncbi:hypothetical protein GGI43DRAFT_393592 [Trichoderma evansii]
MWIVFHPAKYSASLSSFSLPFQHSVILHIWLANFHFTISLSIHVTNLIRLFDHLFADFNMPWKFTFTNASTGDGDDTLLKLILIIGDQVEHQEPIDIKKGDSKTVELRKTDNCLVYNHDESIMMLNVQYRFHGEIDIAEPEESKTSKVTLLLEY